MYNQGLAMIERTATDLNSAHLASIRAEVKRNNLVPQANYFLKVKSLFSGLKSRVATAPILSVGRGVFLAESDCENAASPCA